MAKGTLNKVMLIGRAGQDPDLRYTEKGTAVSNFSLATHEKFNDEEQTDWHNIVCFGKLAEVVGQYVSKGKLLYVEGRIRIEKFEKEGETRYFTKIYARSVQFLAGSGNGNSQAGSDSEEQPEAIKSEADDLPF